MNEFRGALKGHGLKFEGRVMTYFGMGTGPGRGKCSCGAESETLPTTAARQRWHREHKAEVAAQMWAEADRAESVAVQAMEWNH